MGRAILPAILIAALLGLDRPASSVASQIGVYFDSSARENSSEVGALQEFTWYVLASDVGNGMKGYEFALLADPDITITGRVPMPEGRAVNVGGGDDNWIVGTGGCMQALSPTPLVLYSGMLLSRVDNVRIQLGEASPASASGPAYADCDNNVWSFDTVSGASLNTAEQSWGAVKNLYRD